MVGIIIFARLLEQPLWKYFAFVKQVEGQPLFEQWLHHGWVWKENLSRLCPLMRPPTREDAMIGEYVKRECDEYEIRYCHPYFQCCYRMDEALWRRFAEDAVEKRLLHQLRRVNSRNALTHCLLDNIAKEQKDYLSTGDILHLKPLTQVELAKRMNQNTNNSRVCHSWLSRLISNLTIMLPDGSERPLKVLLPTRRDQIKRALRELLNGEGRKIMEGLLKAPYNDRQLQELLHSRFDIATTRRNISAARRELGIPSARVRSQHFWYLLDAPFSGVYPLTAKEISLHVPETRGVYELRLREGQVTYPKGTSPVFYIGRSKNLKKRLTEHLRLRTKNKTVVHYLQRGTCNFRFLAVIPVRDYRERKEAPRGQILDGAYIQEEKQLYDLFVSTFGAPPAGNRISPGGMEE